MVSLMHACFFTQLPELFIDEEYIPSINKHLIRPPPAQIVNVKPSDQDSEIIDSECPVHCHLRLISPPFSARLKCGINL